MRSQAFSDQQKAQNMMSQKTMEISPRHPIIAELNELVAAEKDDETTADLAWMLLDNALMASGFPPHSLEEFSSRVYRLLQKGLSLDSLDLKPEIEIPDEPEVNADAGDDFADLDDMDLSDLDDFAGAGDEL